jgi:hypothetical protein
MTEMDIAYQRLHNQQVSQSTFRKPEDVVRWMGRSKPKIIFTRSGQLGFGCKMRPQWILSKLSVDRIILRAWPMRGTIHFVPAEDAAWVLHLLSQQLICKEP